MLSVVDGARSPNAPDVAVASGRFDKSCPAKPAGGAEHRPPERPCLAARVHVKLQGGASAAQLEMGRWGLR